MFSKGSNHNGPGKPVISLNHSTLPKKVPYRKPITNVAAPLRISRGGTLNYEVEHTTQATISII